MSWIVTGLRCCFGAVPKLLLRVVLAALLIYAVQIFVLFLSVLQVFIEGEKNHNEGG